MTKKLLAYLQPYLQNKRFVIGAVFLFLIFATEIALTLPIAIRPSSYSTKIGDVADQDILAPRSLSYPSEVLTEQVQSDAVKVISPVFLPADPAISRKQIERLRSALNYINLVRLDAFASNEQRINDLQNLEDIQISKENITNLLNFTDLSWQTVQQETVRSLETIMRNTIRDEQVAEFRRAVPTYVSFSLYQDQANCVAELVSPFIIANSLYSAEQTEALKQRTLEAIVPVTKSYSTGEIIVRRGQIITPIILEALQEFNLIHSNKSYPDLIASLLYVIVVFCFIFLYFFRRKFEFIQQPRNLLLTIFCYLFFLYSARLLIPNHTVIPYLFPFAAFALIISTLINFEIAMVLALALGVLIPYELSNNLELTLLYVFSSLCGVLVLGNGRRIASFFWTGFVIGFSGCAIVFAFRLPGPITDWLGIATLSSAAVLSGLVSASLTLIFQFFFSQVTGVATAIQLLDLSRPDHPLLQFLLRNAPGTYQHSLQLANLTEQAAEAIGADTLLVRIGAIYHDVGKAKNAAFFIENQVPGKLNPHDDMDPVVCAALIIRHVEDGIELARKYRLPTRVQDFIKEHHGVLLTRYQYARALESVGNNHEHVNQELFRYPGPKPGTRETALLMLADMCEARARAEIPKNEEELHCLVKSIFDFCLREGQLDETQFTLRDLQRVSDSFINTLRNSYHSRIEYPQIPQSIEQTPPSSAASAFFDKTIS